MYIKLPNIYPYNLERLFPDNPQISFPNVLSLELLAEYDIYPVSPTNQPTYDNKTHRIEEILPIQVDGIWTQQWEIYELTSEEINIARNSMKCSPRQARLALQQVGLLTAVTNWIATANEITQIEWEFALVIKRNWTALNECAVTLGLSETQLDDLFRLAVTL